MIEIAVLVFSVIFVGYVILRISRRGISKRYERKPANSWNSLNEGIDPTI